MGSEAHLETGLLAGVGEPVERILAAAENCFSTSGYAATSMRQIADAAGVSKSLLHYHFQSKEHLFLETTVRIYNRLAAEITEGMGETGTSSERALFALDALFASLKRTPYFQVQTEVWARSLTNESLRMHAERLREHLRGEIIHRMGQILGPAQAQIPLSLETMADLLWATVSGLGLQAMTDRPERVEAAFGGFRQLVVLALSLSEDERGDA